MTRIVVDPNLQQQLAGASGEVELCDAAGNVLGRFTPACGGSEWELESPHPSDEELRRLAQSDPRRFTTSQVLEHLQRLEHS